MTHANLNLKSRLANFHSREVIENPLPNQQLATELLASIAISLICILKHATHDGWDWKLTCALTFVLSSPFVTRASVNKSLDGLAFTRVCDDPLGISAGVALLPGAVGSVSEWGAAAIFSSAFWTAAVAIFGVRFQVTTCVASAVLLLSAPLLNAGTMFAATGAPFVAYLLLVSCRKSFSIAEAAAVAAAMAAAFATGCRIVLEHRHPVCGEGDVDAVVGIGLAGCVLLWLFSVLPGAAVKQNDLTLSSGDIFSRRRAFFISCSFCAVVLVTYVAVWVKGTGCEPISWASTFISNKNGWSLVFIWAFIITLTIAMARPGRSGVERVVARKFYHFVAALVFGIGLVFDRDLMRLGAIVGLGLLSLGEASRVTDYGGVSKFVNDIGKRLVDERDAGIITVTHIYLLLGCAVPIWMSDDVVSHAGVVSVCIQDAVAAAVGKMLGVHQWGRRGRTLEGSLAGFVAATATMVFWCKTSLASASAAAAATAVVEAYTEQIDNWVVPMTFSTVIATIR